MSLILLICKWHIYAKSYKIPLQFYQDFSSPDFLQWKWSTSGSVIVYEKDNKPWKSVVPNPNYMLKDLRVGERTGVAVCGLTDDIDEFFYKANVN